MTVDTMTNCTITMMQSMLRSAKQSDIDRMTLRMLLFSVQKVINGSYDNERVTKRLPDATNEDELIGTLLIEFTCNGIPSQYTMYAFMPNSETGEPYIHLYTEEEYDAFADHSGAYFGLSINWNMLLNDKSFSCSLAPKSRFSRTHIRENFGPNQMYSFIKIVKFACEYLSVILASTDSDKQIADRLSARKLDDIEKIKECILNRKTWMGEHMIEYDNKSDDPITPISVTEPAEEKHINLIPLNNPDDEKDEKPEQEELFSTKPRKNPDEGKRPSVVVINDDGKQEFSNFLSRILGIGGLYDGASDNTPIDFGGRYDTDVSSALDTIDDLISSFSSVISNTLKIDWRRFPMIYEAIDKYISLTESDEESETLYGSEFMEVKELICVFAALKDKDDYTVYGIYDIDGQGKYNVKRVVGAIAKNFVERSQRKAYPCIMISDATSGASLSTTPRFINASKMDKDILHKDFLCLFSAVFKNIYKDHYRWLKAATPDVIIEREDFGALLSSIESNKIFTSKQKIKETIALMDMITEYIATGNRFISGMEEPIKHLYDTYIETPFGDYFYDCEDLMWKLNATENEKQKSVFGFSNKFTLYHEYFRMDINDVQWANTTLYEDIGKVLKYLDATLKEEKDDKLLKGIRFRN